MTARPRAYSGLSALSTKSNFTSGGVGDLRGMGGCDRGLAGTQPARVFGAVVYLLPRPVDDGIGPRKDPFASATGMTSLRPKERGPKKGDRLLFYEFLRASSLPHRRL
jgi:hypothetical protein